MKNIIPKLTLLLSFTFVMVSGMLLSNNLTAYSSDTMFLNFSIAFLLLIFAFLVLETLRKIAINEQIDFNQNKIDIIHSSFILMDGNAEVTDEEVTDYEDIRFNYITQPPQPQNFDSESR